MQPTIKRGTIPVVEDDDYYYLAPTGVNGKSEVVKESRSEFRSRHAKRTAGQGEVILLPAQFEFTIHCVD